MHFPLVSDFPLFSKKIPTLWKIFKIVRFLVKISRFSSARISDDLFLFLVIDHKFRIFPYFSCFSKFPPCFAKNYHFPLLFQISPCFRKIHMLFTYFMCISFPPYFDHNARIGRPCNGASTPRSTSKFFPCFCTVCSIGSTPCFRTHFVTFRCINQSNSVAD